MSGHVWSTQSGYLFNPELNKKLQYSAQPRFRFRQFVDIKEAFGKGKGDSVNWDKVANVTAFGQKLVETSTMPETVQALTKGTLSVFEYGNSIPFTGKLEALSMFDIEGIVRKGLMDDMVKCIDGEVERQFNATKLQYVGTATAGGALTTNGTATATNTSAFNVYHLGQMADQLRRRNVPGYESADGGYMLIASVEALRGLKDSLAASHAQVDENYAKLVNGGQFSYDNVTVMLDTFATRFIYDSTAGTATAKVFAGSGASLDAYMFGADTVREAVAVPEEVRVKIPSDYGRSKGIAWYFLGGWQLEWTDEPNTRIIKWASA